LLHEQCLSSASLEFAGIDAGIDAVLLVLLWGILLHCMMHVQSIPNNGVVLIELALCSDPSHMVLGYAWGSADEKKMQKSFGMGKADLFTNFLDLQSVSECLGYQGLGLASLIQMVLGCASYKSKRVRTQSCMVWMQSQVILQSKLLLFADAVHAAPLQRRV
jgi:hypothetical protein